MSQSIDAAMPYTGDTLGGRYVLSDRVGAGGMGRVFRARDTVLARDVAIKLFHTDRADAIEPGRRLSEARVLAAFDHPSLVTLYDARLDAGDHIYLVMEYVDGPSLQRRIEAGALEPAFVAALLVDLARALAAVHATGVVHRDVKPSNVLLRPTRHSPHGFEAVLADFGVAHLIDATRLTTPGTVIGTAAYLAPEQVRGEPPQPASDIYSLGLLTIEALTRLHPYQGGTLQETVLARLACPPSIPASLGREWASLLTDMTAFDPAVRPPAAVIAERAAALTFSTDIEIPDADDLDLLDLLDVETAPWTPLPDLEASASASTLATSPPTPPSSGDRRRRATARRRPAIRRAWLGAAVLAAVLVVGGHVLALSLLAPTQHVTEIAPSPSPSAPAAQEPVPAQQVAVPGSR
ncbi:MULTISPECIES: serine/threonine-protein kinase [Microbacterium]|uniref:serine/threonine-protein kinase n=1 Tax=Microbacterium TaxID=33882 RepID=UPI00278B71D0|nr:MULTISPECIES: serine/threonine-protein kinase [Microbacterium]MDQ1077060.1 serine/threonine protein kinase [Microbacterium sp. SORGH_AS_0969]MDQ1117303.1 serine/threonine protein kinase [Microbacterium testaceum]